jgi:hypothetical protein
LTIRALTKVVEALDARLVLDIQWQGADLDRLIDAHHAALVESIAAFLRRHGWDCRPEVSFNRYGDRGRYDLLAYHPASRVVIVVEVKTSVGDLQQLLGSLDVKTRLARHAAGQIGWQPVTAATLLVLAENSTNRRQVASHPTLFSGYQPTGRDAYRWLRRPAPPPPGHAGTRLLVFRKLSAARAKSVISQRRVRRSSCAPRRSS